MNILYNKLSTSLL